MKFEDIRRVCNRLCLQCGEHCCPKVKNKGSNKDSSESDSKK